jgi:hypothetical protein
MPVNPDIDRGIAHTIPPEAFKADNMPTATLLPPCPKSAPGQQMNAPRRR